MEGAERYEQYMAQKRPCREVYPGGCNQEIGPPNWDHRIGHNLGPVPKHPTREMALSAAQGPQTLPDVLWVLGDYDAKEYKEVHDAARANPNHPPGTEAG